MANSDKNIRITANRDTTALPKIIFTGQSNNPIALNVLDDNTLSFEGSAGQLFSINNNLASGYIFSINDISGIPSFRVNADGTVGIAEFLGNVGIGLTNPAYKLQISGSAGISGTANISGVLTLSSFTGSASTTTGALVVSGGVGIGGSIFSSSSYASNISGVVFNNGAITNTGTITSTGVMTISNSSTTAFQVRDGSNNAAFVVDTIGDVISLPVAIATTSTNTGSLVVAGGVGIGQSVIIGGRVGIGTVPNLSMLNIRTSSAGTTGLSISASPSQSANLFEWYADGGVGGGYSLSGRIRPSGHVNLGNPGTINMSTGTSALLSLQGRGSTEGLAIRGFNSAAFEPLFEIQGNPGNQLFGIYGDGGVNAPRINVTNSTGSTSTSTGALIVSGGVGIGGSLYVASATAISGVTINAGVITGSLTGTATSSGFATTANYSNESGYGITAGTANTSTYSHQSGYGLTSGLATTSSYSHQSGYATTSGTATTATYSFQSGYGITAGLATTATFAHQSGYAITSGSSGSATTANNINVANALSNSAHTLLFSPTATGSGVAVSSNTTLSYNPSSFVLSTSGLAITATTASSSTSNGALQVAGGVGISGRLSFNQAAFGTTGIASIPSMAMIGNTGDPIFLSILEDNTISFEGSQGQLFSITPNLSTGYIYSVNDITGIPLLRANANANVTANEYAGNFGIGLSNPGYKLHVVGSVGFTSTTASTSTTTGTLVVSGGVGIGGSLNVNSASNISNVIINNGVVTGNLTGTATTATYAGLATTALYSHQAGYAITSGSATTAVTSVSSTSVSVASAGSSNLAHPILITNNPSSGSAVSSDSTFTFNPSTEILSVSGISITSTTASTNTTTGALIVSGGVGIGGSLFVSNKTGFSDEVRINSISSNAFTVAGSGGVSYTWTVGTTLTASRFNLGFDLSLSPVGGNQSVVQSFWGLQLTGNTGVVPTSFTPTSYGARDAIGVLVPNQQAGRVAFGIIAHASQTADLQIWTSSTASTSSPYLAVKSNGQLYSYSNIPSTSFDSGALVVTGGVGIGGSLFVNGDLTINGTTTTINSVTLSVDDKNIELGSVSSPSDVTAEGGGITLRGATDKFINWYSGVGWSSSESWNLVSGNSYKINNVDVLNATTLGTGVTNSSLTSLGTITTGVWAGTLITALYGGIGLTTPFTVGDILYANTSTTWDRLAAGTSGHLLSSTGTGSTPSYINPNTLTVGSATTAANLRIASAGSSNLSHPVLFSPNSSTSGSAVSSDSTFSFNSSTEVLSVSGVAITSTTASSGSTTGALTVAGGVGIGGTVNIAGDETVLGRLYYSQSTVGVAGTSTIPSISFIGQDNNPITLSVLTDNTLSFEGSSGQLFSINNNLSSGTIFSVNDISGIPIIRANANGTLSMGEFTGTVGVGLTNPSFKFHVSGSAGFSGTIYATGNVSLASNTASTSTTNGALTVAGGVGIGGSLYVASATAISGVTINAGVITGSLTGTASTATYSHQSGYAITSGIATTAGYASIANTSYSVNVVSASANSSHYLIFSPNASGSGIALSTESALVYNPSTDILSASGISITSSTASTSTSTGALIVAGGVGIGNSLYVNGRVDAGNYKAWVENRTLSSVDTCVGIGTFYINNGAHNLVISLNVSDAGYSVAKNYSLTSYYNASGWFIVAPISSMGYYNNASIDFQLEAYQSANNLTLRARSLGTGGNLKIYVQNVGQNTATFTAYNTATSETALTSYFPSAFVSQEKYQLKVNSSTVSTSTSTGALVVTGGVGIGQSLFTSSSYPSSISGVVFNNGAITNTGTITSTGVMSISNSSTTAFSVKDGSNDTKFNVNTIGGIVSVSSSTASTNTSTGALTVTGGVGIGQSVNIGGKLDVSNTINYTATNSGIANTWTRISIPSPVSISGLTYGNGLYVGVGYSAATSTDGVNWTARSLPHNLTGVGYGNGLYVGVLYGSALGATSTDGITWRSMALPASTNWLKVAYGNGIYVASADSTTVAYSYNGFQWATTGLSWPGGFLQLAPVEFGGGYFIIRSNGSSSYWISVDGINWTRRTNFTTNNVATNSVAYGDGAWVLAGSSASLAYTKDLLSFTYLSHYGWSGSFNYIAYTNGTFAIVDANSLQCTLIYKDLSSINASYLPGPTTATTITAGEGKFVAGAGSTVYITDIASHTFNIFPNNSGELNNVRIGAKLPSSAQFSHLNAYNLASFGSSSPTYNTTSGAVVVIGGVGIGQSINVGGRVGIGTNLLTGQINIKNATASTPSIVIQGATSQSEDYLRVMSSTGVTSFLLNSSYQFAWPSIGTLKVYGTSYSSTGRLQVDGCLSVGTGPFLVNTNGTEANMTSSGISFGGGAISWGQYAGTTMSTGNPVRIGPTSSYTYGLWINAENGWSSGNLLRLSNNGNNVFNVDYSGITNIYSTAGSASTTTGALIVAGGVGIGQTLFTSASYASSVSGVILSNGTATGNLTGTATTATYAHQAGYAITSGSSGSATTATYAHQSGYATTSGFATTASYSYQSGYGITAGFATSSTSASIANTSYSVNVNAASANSSHFLIFSPTATGSGVALSTESALVYNPSTDILSVSGLAVTSGTASTSATTGALVVTGGVGIGQTLTVGLGISTPSVSAPASLIIKPGVDSTTGIQLTRSSSAIPVLTIDTLNSRVGIGLTNPEFDFEVNGSISATTKSFVIEHPTKEGMKLRYGSLEGPENGVYVRGELKDNNIIILPDYWSELIDENSITVHLTPIGNKFVYVKEIKKDKIIVGSMFFQKIHCYYSVWAERKDVPKLKVEF